MIKISLFVLFIVAIATGYGIELSKRLKLTKLTFSAPIGFALFLALNQLFYYPVQIFNLNFIWIILITSIFIFIGIFLVIKNLKSILTEYLKIDTIFVLIVFIVFFMAFYKTSIDLEYGDAMMYLNYISQNINIEHLNLFNLYTGQFGAEWDGLYLYQGYYHLISYSCWLINIPHYLFSLDSYTANITISTFSFGMIYNLLSSMFIISITNNLVKKNGYIKYSLMFFTLLFSNFYYWRVSYSFYGNTYRTLIISMIIFYIYLWMKTKNTNYKLTIMILLAAGLACSSSFLFISFTVIFSLMVYLFSTKKTNAFIDLSLIVSPIVLYAVVFINIATPKPALFLLLIASSYYILLFLNKIQPIIKVIEDFLFKYSTIIFLIILPILAAIYSYYLNAYVPTFPYNYTYYFQNHQNYDMVKDYTFRYSDYYDNFLHLLFYIGMLLILIKAKSDEEKWIKYLITTTLLIFLNPLTTTVVAYFIASNVFYRIVEVAFNPVTETFYLLFIFKYLDSRKVIKILLSISLLYITCLEQINSWTDQNPNLYAFLLNSFEKVEPLFKVTFDEHETINTLIELTKNEEYDNTNQLVVISHSNGLRTFIPQAFQLFTARDHFYVHTRIDNDFYQLAQRHFVWNNYEDLNYQDSCSYIYEYNVDYLLIQYKENWEFDIATDGCSVNIFQNSTYKLKKVTN